MKTPGLRIHKIADRSEGRRVRLLVAPPSAITRTAAGDYVIDPAACQRRLVNPDTDGYEHESWPLAGVEFVGEPPAFARIPTRYVDGAVAEGWMTREDETVVHRPGGPEADPWRMTHTFRHAETIVVHTVHGDVRYRVTVQPDKQHPNRPGEPGDVWHFYDVELDG